MAVTSTALVETHQLGGSAYVAVKCPGDDIRSWLAASPECPQMERKHIAHAGVMEAVHPFRVVRLFQSGTFMFACLSGCGEVMVDGRWVRMGANEACLLPPFTANAIRAIQGESVWKFCWVRYLESPVQNPLVSAKSPVKGVFAAAPLLHAVMGLHAEASKRAPSAAQSHLWIELLQGYVTTFAQPAHGDSRLWRLWQAVEADLGRAWPLAEMAEVAAMSEEHLRRLCASELGRSPHKHVTSLRMQHACRLLSTTDDKIATVAKAVGYASPFTFSNTFRQWTGIQPSAHRNSPKSDAGLSRPTRSKQS
jgi:AraC-like DNA-binding protein